MADKNPTDPQSEPSPMDTTGAESIPFGSESPTSPLGDAALPEPRPTMPAPSGRYQVFEEIARGGMGAILRGRDNDLRREIAFKVLLESRENDPQVVRRFVEEARIGGQLQHPGIVPVYELGRFADHRPYFTMKLVQGRTLARLLAERKDPSQDLPRFLGVFQQVCLTMAFAHARGVIHRDLKPQNVMVGEFGEVQVMDWGLAKVLDPVGMESSLQDPQPRETVHPTPAALAMESQPGSVLGTPAYMPPEQARGEVDRLDERSDVFGLGAILCEILTGKPPFVGGETWRVLMLAAEAQLADAFSRLDTCGVDADLLRLAKSCLAADPADRPRNAGEAADVVTAYLTGVQERLRAAEMERATAEAKAAAERRTRRRTVALAMTLIASVLLGSLGWVSIERARDARRETTARSINEVLGTIDLLVEQAWKAPAEDAGPWNDALAAVEKAEGMLATGETDADTRDRVERLRLSLDEEAAEAARDRRMLARLEVILLDRFIERRGSFDLGAIHDAYAAAFKDYGIDIPNLTVEEAVSRLRSRRILQQLATALDSWAHHLPRKSSDPADALWKHMVAVAGRATDDPWRKELYAALHAFDGPTLIALAEKTDITRMPSNPMVLGEILVSRGAALGRRDEIDAGLALLRRGRERYPREFGLNLQLAWAYGLLKPTRWDEQLRYATAAVSLRPDNAMAHLNLSMALAGLKRWDEALKELDVAERLNPESADVHGVRAIVLRDQKDPEAAIKSLVKAIALSPRDVSYHTDLGSLHLAQKRPKEALACYERALKIAPKQPAVHVQRGRAMEALSRPEEALECLRRALEIDPKSAPAHAALASLLVRLERFPEAVEAYEEAINRVPDDSQLRNNFGLLLRRVRGEDAAIAQFDEAIRLDPNSYEANYNRGQALAARNSYQAALGAFRRAVQIAPNRPEAHYGVGMCCDLLGEPENSAAAFREAHRLAPNDARTLDRLGRVLWRKRSFAEAVPVLSKAVALDDKNADGWFHLGDTLRAMGQFAQAVEPLQKAIRLDPDNRVDARINLGFVLNRLGRVDDALTVLQEAAERHPNHALLRCNLGVLLKVKGKFRDALVNLERADELAKRQPGLRLPTVSEIQECRQLLVLEEKLPAVLSGELKLERAEDMIVFARFCRQYRGLNAAAAGLYEKAFAQTPALTENPAGHRHDAAIAAALAGCGKGEDGAKLEERDRAVWRRKAVAWLRQDVSLHAREAEAGPTPARARQVEQFLKSWTSTPFLAGLRDAAEVQKLPESEREPCRRLWMDVEALIVRLAEVK